MSPSLATQASSLTLAHSGLTLQPLMGAVCSAGKIQWISHGLSCGIPAETLLLPAPSSARTIDLPHGMACSIFALSQNVTVALERSLHEHLADIPTME